MLAIDADRSAVIVEGRAGKGRVVLCGIAIGDPDYMPMREPERLILRWLLRTDAGTGGRGETD